MKKKPRPTHSGLFAKHVRHAVKDFVDYDYVARLSEAEKTWLDKFSREYYLASLDHDGTDIHDPEKYSKDIYNQNNARNRDRWNREWRTSIDHESTNGNTEVEDDE